MLTPNDIKAAERAYSVVGEMILIGSAVDQQMNRVCMLALRLGDTAMLESVFATLDSARKVEILKALASKITAVEWKKRLRAHADEVEVVNRWRNIAAHSVLTFKGETVVLHSPAVAKLFKVLDLSGKSAEHTELGQLESAIGRADKLLAAGRLLIDNLKRISEEADRKKAARPKA